MALTPSTGFMTANAFVSGSLTKLDEVDCSDVLAAVLMADRELLGHIKMGAPAHNVEFQWIEDALNPCTFEALMDDTSVTITIITSFTGTASVANMLREGTIIAPMDRIVGSTFMIRITSAVAATEAVCASYGSTTWVSVTATLTWMVVASPYKDTDDASEDISLGRTGRRNFMQVFERSVGIDQTRKNISMLAITDELQHQIKMRTLEIKRELDLSVIQGLPYHNGTSYTADYNLRTMRGIYWFLRDPNEDKTKEDTMVTSIGGALTVGVINDLAYKIYEAGGLDESSDPIIVVPPNQQRVISSFDKDIRRVEQGERQVGYYRDIFLSDMGKEMPVVMDRWLPSHALLILDRSRMFLRPLQGDSWHMEKMAKTGRHEKWQISGQYGLEFHNPDTCHGMLLELTG